MKCEFVRRKGGRLRGSFAEAYQAGCGLLCVADLVERFAGDVRGILSGSGGVLRFESIEDLCQGFWLHVLQRRERFTVGLRSLEHQRAYLLRSALRYRRERCKLWFGFRHRCGVSRRVYFQRGLVSRCGVPEAFLTVDQAAVFHRLTCGA